MWLFASCILSSKGLAKFTTKTLRSLMICEARSSARKVLEHRNINTEAEGKINLALERESDRRLFSMQRRRRDSQKATKIAGLNRAMSKRHTFESVIVINRRVIPHKEL